MVYTDQMATWFSEAFGFEEADYSTTQEELLSRYNLENQTIADLRIGTFSVPSLEELRNQAPEVPSSRGDVRFENIIGDARALHLDPENEGATFQVASQFNLLEFPQPHAIPEMGVTGYIYDKTQGPACALACPAGTVFRNYLVPMGNETRGQREDLQINTLQDLEVKLPDDYWIVKNGYINSTEQKLQSFNNMLQSLSVRERETLKEAIRIGVHYDVQVANSEHTVNQIYASAVSAGYSAAHAQYWEPLARLVLESAYESTLLTGLIANENRRQRGFAPQPVYLTKLGGGVFGNRPEWIRDSIAFAIENIRKRNSSLSIKLVHFKELDSDYSPLQ